MNALENASFYAIAFFIAVIVLIGTFEWLRDRRNREIYRRTRRDARETVKRQQQHRTAGG